MEENKRINYTLRDYQKSATDNISEIFNREEHNRFAGVVLPTGGGKSFVAIDEILSINNPNYKSKTRTGEINSTSIIYIAPNTEILSQIKLHIVKNVILSIPSLENMSAQEIDSMMREDFPELNFPGIKGIDESSSASEKKNAILREISTKQIDAMVHKAFSGLKFKCYAGVKESGKTEEIDAELDALASEEGLIIVDDAHRVGAETWSVNTENLIKKHINKKVLAITATPERTDSEGRDMMAGIAQIVYPGETIVPDTYMAKEIFVLDAMRDGIVTVPDVIGFNSSLANSKEYQDILEAYSKARGREKEELGHILDEMEKIYSIHSK